VVARKQGDRVRLFTRRGYDWTERYPLISKAVAALGAASATIDGEAVCCDDAGVAVFEKLHSRAHDGEAFLYAFDLLEGDGAAIFAPATTAHAKPFATDQHPLPGKSQAPHRLSHWLSLGCGNRETIKGVKSGTGVGSATFDVGRNLVIRVTRDRPGLSACGPHASIPKVGFPTHLPAAHEIVPILLKHFAKSGVSPLTLLRTSVFPGHHCVGTATNKLL
jgi:ATP dependent DNA ligase-like protein